MITVHNYTKRRIPLSHKEIEYLVESVRRMQRAPRKDLSVVIVGVKRMAKLNAQYRGQQKPTDILSFRADAENEYGDLIICPEYIEKKAREYNQPIKEAYAVLCIHGMLHLLGYDHETDRDFKKMFTQELVIYKRVAKKLRIAQVRSDL